MLLHERWFTDDWKFPIQWSAALTAATWIPLGIALGITALAVLIWKKRGRRDFVPGPIQLGMNWDKYQDLLSWMPLVIGVHAAVTLLVSGVSLRLFVPNLVLSESFLGAVLGLAQISVALSFIYGALTRLSAMALAATWLTGVLVFGPVRLLEHALFLGIAFFLFVTGRGPLAFDMALERLHRPIERLMPYAVPVLRTSIGLSIAVLAFTEKLWNLPMGLAFLETHPFNFFPSLGLESVGDREFLLIAGTVELTFGLLLMSGVFVRLLILALWLPFNLTLPLLGWSELVGHLPIYGIMGLLLVWGEERHESDQALMEGMGEHAGGSGRLKAGR
ncbi:MAG: DoxX protein [Gemmatimonadales bacterium]|nr:DoxX protein [Gemmatimonadales bacterium]